MDWLTLLSVWTQKKKKILDLTESPCVRRGWTFRVGISDAIRRYRIVHELSRVEKYDIACTLLTFIVLFTNPPISFLAMILLEQHPTHYLEMGQRKFMFALNVTFLLLMGCNTTNMDSGRLHTLTNISISYHLPLLLHPLPVWLSTNIASHFLTFISMKIDIMGIHSKRIKCLAPYDHIMAVLEWVNSRNAEEQTDVPKYFFLARRSQRRKWNEAHAFSQYDSHLSFSHTLLKGYGNLWTLDHH